MQVNRRKELFPNVTDEQWYDWKWQVKNRIETLEDLKKYISLTAEEEQGVANALKTLRMAITPYYLSLIDVNNPNDPVRRPYRSRTTPVGSRPFGSVARRRRLSCSGTYSPLSGQSFIPHNRHVFDVLSPLHTPTLCRTARLREYTRPN